MDRNFPGTNTILFITVSLSARRAWIEIKKKGRARRPGQVALRKESVDRNSSDESTKTAGSPVALRKESVDRNIKCAGQIRGDTVSLSARRAWIEIRRSGQASASARTSLSARRAWIEIERKYYRCFPLSVALRKESVDRNGAGKESTC